ncbi:hypothetical protein NIES4071_12610 [Calothrix sp. NIES-4071]|nr:hypothetical protein NIES4071_12610 [Calothrix sp. NIES-4071]BAZ55601.1 hypothetical protein NIES4105_12570 [Calothrix sp. NIES-4105]
MSEEDKNKQASSSDTAAGGGYQSTVDEETRKTGVASKSDAKPTATPEAPENDTVVGSPNQGTESR